MPAFFQRLKTRIFGSKVRQNIETPLGGFQTQQEAEQAQASVEQAKVLAARAKAGEEIGQRHAQEARQRKQQASVQLARAETPLEKRRAQAERQRASQEEAKAMEFARKQREERQRQERNQRDKEHEAQAKLRKQEMDKAKGREAFLRTRKGFAPEEWEETFHGPRPQRPEIDKNVKSGEGELPSEEYFLTLGYEYSAFASSNIRAIQYDPRKGDFYMRAIRRKGPDEWYQFVGVGRQVARAMYQAASKGVQSWDLLRIRGTQTGSRFPVRKGMPPPPYLPLDDESSAAQFAAGGGGL